MSMKVKGDTFFLLLLDEEKWIFESEKKAISSLKEKASNKKDINLEETSIVEVSIGGKEEEWKIKEVPWSRIAMTLIEGEG